MILTARRYLSAVYAMIRCPSVCPFTCPSVTNRCSNKTDKHIITREAQLSQRDRAAHYVNWNLVKCSTPVRKITFYKACSREWHWRSIKVIGIAAIR